MASRSIDLSMVSRRSFLRSSGYAAGAGALATLPFGQALWAHDVSEAWPEIAGLAEKYVGTSQVANIVASLGWGEEKPHSVARGRLGFGNRPPADLDTLYRIYSMTKPITGMAAMILVDEGAIALDQPVADFIPAYADMRVLKDPEGRLDDTVPAEQQITIRHLLTHTGGLGYDITSKGPLRMAFFKRGIPSGQASRLPIPGFPQAEPAPGLEEYAERLASLPLALQPSKRWSYSYGLDVMGRVIEVASGQRFDEFLEDRIFAPCGMTSTFFRVPESEIGRFSDNYGLLGGVSIPIDPAQSSIYLDEPPILWGGSGLVSSPHDFDRFLKMLLGFGTIDGTQVMSEQAVRLGTSDLMPETVDTTGTWLEGGGFGAGGSIHDGIFRWGGAAGTQAQVDFKAGLRAALYTQYMPANALPIGDEFRAAVKADLAQKQTADA